MADSAPAGDDAAAILAGRAGLLARAGHLEYDRILFFSDAVFAIAITLLIVDLPVQIERANGGTAAGVIQSGTELRHAVSGIIGFGISFAVIGLFWMGHHTLFRFIKAIDRRLMLLNLLFLGTIAFLPYPTALLSSVSSNQKAAVIFYAACAGTSGLVETVMWLYATHSRDDLVQGMGPRTERLFLLRTARVPAVFGVSILLALVNARLASYFWIAVWVSGVIVSRLHSPYDAAPFASPPDPPDLVPD